MIFNLECYSSPLLQPLEDAGQFLCRHVPLEQAHDFALRLRAISERLQNPLSNRVEFGRPKQVGGAVEGVARKCQRRFEVIDLDTISAVQLGVCQRQPPRMAFLPRGDGPRMPG